MLLDVPALLPDFQRLSVQLVDTLKSTYGTLARCLPVGSLFGLSDFTEVLSALLEPESIQVAQANRTLPLVTPDLQGQWEQIEGFKIQLWHDYYYDALYIDDYGDYKRGPINLAGPNYPEHAAPNPPWRQPLSIVPGAQQFYLQIYAKESYPEPGQEPKKVVIHAVEYERATETASVWLTFGFAPGIDPPIIEVEGAQPVRYYPPEQPIKRAATKSMAPPPLDLLYPTVIFAVDAGLPAQSFSNLLDNVIVPAARAQMAREPNTLMQLIAVGDLTGASKAPFELALLFDQPVLIAQFLNAMQPSHAARRHLRPYLRLGDRWNGAFETALQAINAQQWGEGVRLLISIGLAKPYEPNEAAQFNKRANWRTAVEQLLQKDVYLASMYLTQFDDQSTAARDAARSFWAHVGQDQHWNEFDGSTAENEAMQNVLDRCLSELAQPMRRFVVDPNIRWPFDGAPWEFPERKPVQA